MLTRTLITLATTAAVALPAAGLAHADDGGAFDGKPWLNETSGGAYVDYALNRKAQRQTVTIDGKRATVKTIKQGDASFFRAFVVKNGLEQGERYKVTVKVTQPNGTRFTLLKRLVLHRSSDRRPAGTVGG